MKVITEPTVVAGDECDLLRTTAPNDNDWDVALQLLLQEAFEAGLAHAGKQPEAVQAIVNAPQAKAASVPHYRSKWDQIDEDGPENAIETFIYHDMPHEADGVNPAGFAARLNAALVFAVKG